MTPDQQKQLQQRLERAQAVKHKLDEGYRVLTALQGGTACTQADVVAAHLQEGLKYPVIMGISCYTEKTEFCLRGLQAIPVEAVALVVQAMRIVVRKLEEEYEAS